MVNSNKILTVSYGTFSCTLEGFEDSFGTMKAIAEYFRDLAADDRYFGAEPPQPDAEMLARIAEREIARRVEARLDGSGIVLRARDSETPPQVPSDPALARPATSDARQPGDARPSPAASIAAPSGFIPAGIAAAAVAETKAAAAAERDAIETAHEDAREAEAEAEAAPEAAPETDAMPDSADADDQSVAAFFAQSETRPEPQSEPQPEPQPEPWVADGEADAASDMPETAIDATVEDTAHIAPGVASEIAAPARDSAPDSVRMTAESIAAKLQRIRAVVARTETARPDDTAEYSEDEHSDAPLSPGFVDDMDDDDNVTAERVLSILGAATAARGVSHDDDEPADADPAATDTAEDDAAEFGDEVADEVADEVGDEVATAEDEDIAPLDKIGDEDADTDGDIGAFAEDRQPAPQARVLKVGRAEFDALMAEAGFDTADGSDPVATDAANDEDATDEDLASEVEAETDEDIWSILDADDDDARTHLDETPEDIFADAPTRHGDLAEDDIDLDDSDLLDDPLLSPEDEDDLRRELADVEADMAKAPTAAEDEADLDDTGMFDDVAEDDYEDEDDRARDVLLTDDAEDLDDAELDEADDDDIESLFAEPREEAPQTAADPAPRDRAARAAAPAVDDDISRLLAETDRNLGGSDSASRRSDFDHLRAAVAAKRAESAAGGEIDRKPSENPYRLDLAQVVRPRRPEAPSDTRERSRRPDDQKPAPLKLVAAQRVDAQAAPVTPRRVMSEPVMEKPAAAEGAMSFAEFAERSGAVALPDLLEAAASYLSFVEKRAEFSRPQLMSKVRALDPDEFTREDGLRSFGQLLRDGKIEKIQGGRFTVSDSIGFRPEDLRAAG